MLTYIIITFLQSTYHSPFLPPPLFFCFFNINVFCTCILAPLGSCQEPSGEGLYFSSRCLLVGLCSCADAVLKSRIPCPPRLLRCTKAVVEDNCQICKECINWCGWYTHCSHQSTCVCCNFFSVPCVMGSSRVDLFCFHVRGCSLKWVRSPLASDSALLSFSSWYSFTYFAGNHQGPVERTHAYPLPHVISSIGLVHCDSPNSLYHTFGWTTNGGTIPNWRSAAIVNNWSSERF